MVNEQTELDNREGNACIFQLRGGFEIAVFTLQAAGCIALSQRRAKKVRRCADGGARVREDGDLAFFGGQAEFSQACDRSRRATVVVGALLANAVAVNARLERGLKAAVKGRGKERPDGRIKHHDGDENGQETPSPRLGQARERRQENHRDDEARNRKEGPARNQPAHRRFELKAPVDSGQHYEAKDGQRDEITQSPPGLRQPREPSAKDRAKNRQQRDAKSFKPGVHAGRNKTRSLSSHLSLRKFLRICRPFSVRMLSGWNCTPQIGNCLCLTPMISPSSVSAVISRQSGSVSR